MTRLVRLPRVIQSPVYVNPRYVHSVEKGDRCTLVKIGTESHEVSLEVKEVLSLLDAMTDREDE